MARIKKELDAWPESTEQLLSLVERFERLRQKHSKGYELSLSFFWVPTSRSEIEVVLNADDKLVAAGELLGAKLDFWS